MADAWTNLLVHSSISTGDAWEHLLAQEGGSGLTDRYVSDSALLFDIKPKTIVFNSSIVTELFDDIDLEG